LRRNLDLAGAVRRSGQPVDRLDPVLAELIAQNLVDLAWLQTRPAPAGGRPGQGWRAIQVLSILGWAAAAITAISVVGAIPTSPAGLVISTITIDAPLWCLLAVISELVRRPPTRAGENLPETLAERTHDLAAELVPTLPLGHRNTLEEVLGRRAQLGPTWRVGRAAVPRPAPRDPS
jgi:hypothetical protein